LPSSGSSCRSRTVYGPNRVPCGDVRAHGFTSSGSRYATSLCRGVSAWITAYQRRPGPSCPGARDRLSSGLPPEVNHPRLHAVVPARQSRRSARLSAVLPVSGRRADRADLQGLLAKSPRRRSSSAAGPGCARTVRSRPQQRPAAGNGFEGILTVCGAWCQVSAVRFCWGRRPS
jgi:hypothetical protein